MLLLDNPFKMEGFQFLRSMILFLTIIFCQQYSIADDYFWIGGNGNWSDINHWAKTSGGSVLHIQIPTSDDNVVFDQNSFSSINQIVTVNTENAICKSMDWTASLYNPKLSGTMDNNIRLYGSLTLIESMDQSFNGTISFEGTNQGNIIKSAGNTFNNHITFDGIGGSWGLLDDLSANGNIYILNGTFQTENHDLICQSFFSPQSNLRAINISNSNLYLTGSWNINGSNLTLNAENSSIEITDGNFTNLQGDTLKLWNLHMTSISQAFSTNVYSTFNNIDFIDGGLLEGNLSADTVLFHPTALNCVVSQNTNIKFLSLQGLANNVSGNNYIHTLYGEYNFIVTGNNTIDSAYVRNTTLYFPS